MRARAEARAGYSVCGVIVSSPSFYTAAGWLEGLWVQCDGEYFKRCGRGHLLQRNPECHEANLDIVAALPLILTRNHSN